MHSRTCVVTYTPRETSRYRSSSSRGVNLSWSGYDDEQTRPCPAGNEKPVFRPVLTEVSGHVTAWGEGYRSDIQLAAGCCYLSASGVLEKNFPTCCRASRCDCHGPNSKSDTSILQIQIYFLKDSPSIFLQSRRTSPKWFDFKAFCPVPVQNRTKSVYLADSWQDSSDAGLSYHKAATHTEHKARTNADINLCLHEPANPVFERTKSVCALDRAVTVIYSI
jgi:hypothetical protein